MNIILCKLMNIYYRVASTITQKAKLMRFFLKISCIPKYDFFLLNEIKSLYMMLVMFQFLNFPLKIFLYCNFYE